ncbi:CBFD_NFYB_HMF domain-containing protein [Cephalotus follicularis]|uniref:CBFD_NFYB_HMF domain-containing protein n=1 Tax=Cephalotus follicularis TaxID=3775 RepID=A0A1Q3BLX1_CEPFO|nr:CBFD_NFYB_HMF domain-containing protein [Cephalotus follicularis]
MQQVDNSIDHINADNNGNTTNKSYQTQESGAREQDQYMPIANVIRIMHRILPSHAKISDDAKETIQECVSEFISFATGEANERCQREQRKTVNAEDVLWAMGKLGFDNYIQSLLLYLNRYREYEHSDRSSLRMEPNIDKCAVDYGLMGMPGPGAGMAANVSAVAGIGPPYGPMFTIAYHHGLYDATAIGGYYKDGSDAGASPSETQTAVANFDPHAQFKYQ